MKTIITFLSIFKTIRNAIFYKVYMYKHNQIFNIRDTIVVFINLLNNPFFISKYIFLNMRLILISVLVNYIRHTFTYFTVN